MITEIQVVRYTESVPVRLAQFMQTVEVGFPLTDGMNR